MNRYNIQSRTNLESRATKQSKNRYKELGERYKKEYTVWRENICQYCGKTFVVDEAHKQRKYCSDNCRKLASLKRRNKYYCQICGKEIVSKNGKHYFRHYCDECFIKWRKSHQYKRILVNCAYCGKEIEVIPSRSKNNKNCYCDVNCMAKHYSETNSGENSPTWKGGKSHHYIGNFFTARKECRKRDNYTCQLCGITEEKYGQQLSVHHIKNYRTFVDKIEANQLDNLICLCEPCHRFIHSKANKDKLFIEE